MDVKTYCSNSVLNCDRFRAERAPRQVRLSARPSGGLRLLPGAVTADSHSTGASLVATQDLPPLPQAAVLFCDCRRDVSLPLRDQPQPASGQLILDTGM